MNINRCLRIKVARKLFKKYEKLSNEVDPYGYDDPMKYYYLMEYWEDVLEKLKKD